MPLTYSSQFVFSIRTLIRTYQRKLSCTRWVHGKETFLLSAPLLSKTLTLQGDTVSEVTRKDQIDDCRQQKWCNRSRILATKIAPLNPPPKMPRSVARASLLAKGQRFVLLFSSAYD